MLPHILNLHSHPVLGVQDVDKVKACHMKEEFSKFEVSKSFLQMRRRVINLNASQQYRFDSKRFDNNFFYVTFQSNMRQQEVQRSHGVPNLQVHWSQKLLII